MANKMFGVLAVCLVIFAATSVKADCGGCMASNDAVCLDRTTYYVCVGGTETTPATPVNTTLHTCPTGQVCTTSENICEPEAAVGTEAWEVQCETNTGNCGSCPVSGSAHTRYTCVSRTQFARCDINGVRSDVISSCPDGLACNMVNYQATGSICTAQCVIDFLEYEVTCTNEEVAPTTSTTIAPTPPPRDRLVEICTTAYEALATPTAVFYTRNTDDTSCTTFIFCERYPDASYEPVLLRCKAGNYYQDSGFCSATRPATC